MELVMVVNLQFYKGKIVIKSKIEIRKYSFRAYREARRFMCFVHRTNSESEDP